VEEQSDLDVLAVGDYALPIIASIPAIDAFGVVADTMGKETLASASTGGSR
jgi:hypothetical protein